METMTTTKLRTRLFAALKRAALGDSFIVQTKSGPVSIGPATRGALKRKDGGPRIPGCIVRDLDQADEALRDHLTWPK